VIALKRILYVVLVLVMVCAVFPSCIAQGGPQPTERTAIGNASATPQDDAANTAAPESAGLTLAQIKTAAEVAGYIVSDGDQFILMDDIVEGITIEIVADGAHTLYSVAECATEEAAKKNAQEIDDAGYAISLRNGRFFSCYDAENKGEERKKLLTAILQGTPLPAPPYPDGAQTSPTQTQAPSLAGIPAYDPSIIPDGGIQEGEGFVEDGELYIRILGIEKTLLDDQSGIVLHYEMTNLSDGNVNTQALYVEVLQNGAELEHPYTFEPAYLTVTELAPGETLAFYDEYLLDNEQDPVEARIRQFLVLVFEPPWVVKSFPLE
jgi:hypothetical protein